MERTHRAFWLWRQNTQSDNRQRVSVRPPREQWVQTGEERQQEEMKSRRRPGVRTAFKSPLHSAVCPWCAQEEFNVWKRSRTGTVVWSRCLDCRKRRARPVGSAVQPSDNIFPAAAPSGLWFFFFFISLLTVLPQMSQQWEPITLTAQPNVTLPRPTLTALYSSTFKVLADLALNSLTFNSVKLFGTFFQKKNQNQCSRILFQQSRLIRLHTAPPETLQASYYLFNLCSSISSILIIEYCLNTNFVQLKNVWSC